MLKSLLLVFLLFFSTLLQAQDKLRVGHMLYSSLDASPKDIKITLSLWMQELSKSIGIDLESKFYTSIEDMREALQNGEINYMIIRSIDVIKYFDQNNLIPGFAPQKRNRQNDKLLLLSSKKNSSLSIRDFKNKKIGLCKSNDVAKMYLETLLMQNNLPNGENYFYKTLEYQKCSKSLLELFFKKIDLAIVSQATLDILHEINPQVSHFVATLESKKIRSSMVGFFSKSTDKDLINKFIAGMHRVNASTRAKQILTLFKADSLQKTNQKELKELEIFYLEYLKLKKRSSK